MNQNDSLPPISDEEFKAENIEQTLELMTSKDDLNLSQFILGENNKEKFTQVDLIHDITKDHHKFQQILK